MKKIIGMILFFIVFKSNGQDVPIDLPITNKIQLGINFSPDICYRTLKINDENFFTQSLVEYRNETEKMKLGYTTGISISYMCSKRISLEAGLQFANKGYTRKLNIDYKTVDPEPLYSIIEDLKYRDIFYYIEVPLKANFFIGNKRTRFIASTGVSVNLFVKSVEVVTYTFSDVKHKDRTAYGDSFNNIDIAPFISAGIDYKLTDKLNIRIEPTFRYTLFDIIDTPIATNLWSGGLKFGCYIGI